MRSESEAHTQLCQLQPTEFPFLEQLKLAREFDTQGCSAYTLTMLMHPALPALSNRRLKIVFAGVQGTRIGDLEGLLRLRIEIRWVGDNQMEGLRYRVVETEHETLSFYCQDFEAILLVEPSLLA